MLILSYRIIRLISNYWLKFSIFLYQFIQLHCNCVIIFLHFSFQVMHFLLDVCISNISHYITATCKAENYNFYVVNDGNLNNAECLSDSLYHCHKKQTSAAIIVVSITYLTPFLINTYTVNVSSHTANSITTILFKTLTDFATIWI